jgi:hypothetical protein
MIRGGKGEREAGSGRKEEKKYGEEACRMTGHTNTNTKVEAGRTEGRRKTTKVRHHDEQREECRGNETRERKGVR